MNKKSEILPPSLGESCAITTYDKFKQAALLFDKVHMECGNFQILSELGNPPKEILFCIPKCDIFDQEEKANIIQNHKKWSEDHPLKTLHTIWKYRVNSYANYGIEVIPLYESNNQFELDYKEGDFLGYQGALNNLSIVDDSDLEWRHILEFRADEEATRKYRALRLWLQEALKSKSISEATDIIGTKLDSYEWAIKKHGFKTSISAMTQVLDPKTLVTLSGGATLTSLLAGPVAGALAGGLMVGARAITWGAEKKLELEDIKRGKDSEVAIIYELNKIFGKK